LAAFDEAGQIVHSILRFSWMLKKSASSVLASLRGFPYRTEYASPLRLLRPCWAAFLSILRGCSALVPDVQAIEVLLC
jgi:hypothetical protein